MASGPDVSNIEAKNNKRFTQRRETSVASLFDASPGYDYLGDWSTLRRKNVLSCILSLATISTRLSLPTTVVSDIFHDAFVRASTDTVMLAGTARKNERVREFLRSSNYATFRKTQQKFMRKRLSKTEATAANEDWYTLKNKHGKVRFPWVFPVNRLKICKGHFGVEPEENAVYQLPGFDAGAIPEVGFSIERIGSYGSGRLELRRPTGIAIYGAKDIYANLHDTPRGYICKLAIADTGNNRIQLWDVQCIPYFPQSLEETGGFQEIIEFDKLVGTIVPVEPEEVRAVQQYRLEQSKLSTESRLNEHASDRMQKVVIEEKNHHIMQAWDQKKGGLEDTQGYHLGKFSSPNYTEFDQLGNLYVADNNTSRLGSPRVQTFQFDSRYEQTTDLIDNSTDIRGIPRGQTHLFTNEEGLCLRNPMGNTILFSNSAGETKPFLQANTHIEVTAIVHDGTIEKGICWSCPRHKRPLKVEATLLQNIRYDSRDLARQKFDMFNNEVGEYELNLATKVRVLDQYFDADELRLLWQNVYSIKIYNLNFFSLDKKEDAKSHMATRTVVYIVCSHSPEYCAQIMDELSAQWEAKIAEEGSKEDGETPPPVGPAKKKKRKSGGLFMAADKFEGAREGYAFQMGPKGLGYYVTPAPALDTRTVQINEDLEVQYFSKAFNGLMVMHLRCSTDPFYRLELDQDDPAFARQLEEWTEKTLDEITVAMESTSAFRNGSTARLNALWQDWNVLQPPVIVATRLNGYEERTFETEDEYMEWKEEKQWLHEQRVRKFEEKYMFVEGHMKKRLQAEFDRNTDDGVSNWKVETVTMAAAGKISLEQHRKNVLRTIATKMQVLQKEKKNLQTIIASASTIGEVAMKAELKKHRDEELVDHCSALLKAMNRPKGAFRECLKSRCPTHIHIHAMETIVLETATLVSASLPLGGDVAPDIDAIVASYVDTFSFATDVEKAGVECLLVVMDDFRVKETEKSHVFFFFLSNESRTVPGTKPIVVALPSVLGMEMMGEVQLNGGQTAWTSGRVLAIDRESGFYIFQFTTDDGKQHVRLLPRSCLKDDIPTYRPLLRHPWGMSVLEPRRETGAAGGGGSGGGDSTRVLAVADHEQHCIHFFDNKKEVKATNLSLSHNGSYLYTVGEPGTGLGQLRGPKGIEFDSFGRLMVCDSKNNRIQGFRFLQCPDDDIFRTEDEKASGRLRGQWVVDIEYPVTVLGVPDPDTTLEDPSDIAVDAYDHYVVADTGHSCIKLFRRVVDNGPYELMDGRDVHASNMWKYDRRPGGKLRQRIPTIHLECLCMWGTNGYDIGCMLEPVAVVCITPPQDIKTVHVHKESEAIFEEERIFVVDRGLHCVHIIKWTPGTPNLPLGKTSSVSKAR